jgi:hypothetical protein
VAKITNPEWWDDGYMDGDPMAALDMDDGAVYSPSTDWAFGGPIIERETITVEYTGDPDTWCACIMADQEVYGPTALIAGMRCYVASVLGDTIDIPEELI